MPADERAILEVGVAIVALAALALALGVGTRVTNGPELAALAILGALGCGAATLALAGRVPARRRHLGSLAIVTLVGAFLRLHGNDFGLPFVPHPDEPAIVNIAQRMLRTGDPNPRSFIYPSLYIYLQAGVYALHLLWGFTQGIYRGVGDLPLTTDLITTAPGIYRWGRGLTALLSTAAIPLIWGAGRRLYGPGIGLLAALLLALSPAMIDDAHLITVDAPAGAFTALALFWIVALYRAPLDADRHFRPWPIARAGIGVGLAVATKYNAGLILLPLLLVPLLRGARSPWRVWLGGAGATAATFLLATPYALRELPLFLGDTAGVITHYKFLGHGVFAGEQNWLYYARYLWRVLGPAWPLALGGLVAMAARGRRADLLVLPFPLLYYGALAGLQVNFTRNLMPLYPFLALAGAVALGGLGRAAVALAHQLPTARGGARPLLRPALLAVVALPPFLVGPAASAGHLDNLRATPDTRVAAQRWMLDHLSRDNYWLVQTPEQQWPRQRNAVAAASSGFGDLALRPPEWYPAHGFGYLLLDTTLYEAGRATPEALAWYAAALARFPLVREFRGIPINLVLLDTGLGRPAMAREGGACFGADDGEIALLGYNLGAATRPSGPFFAPDGAATPTVRAGDRLGLTVLWGVTRTPRDDYQVFVHLRDAAGRTVAQRDTGPQDGTSPTSGWRAGAAILDSADLPLPATLPPGRYSVVVGFAAPRGSRLIVRPAPGAAPLPGDELPLGTIEVVR